MKLATSSGGLSIEEAYRYNYRWLAQWCLDVQHYLTSTYGSITRLVAAFETPCTVKRYRRMAFCGVNALCFVYTKNE